MKQKQFQNRIVKVIPSVKQVLDETNVDENVTNLAIAFQISRNSLQHAFKNETGIGIREYKLNNRMELAKRMLEEGMHIKEIAFTLKYTKTSAFSRAFKNYYGVVPTEWSCVVQNVS